MSTIEPLIEAEDSVPDGDLDSAAEFAPDLPEGRFSNRELSWLKYSERVLAQGEDVTLPLLERMKFLAIFATNLDEFYMVRVAGLKRRADMGLQVPSPDGLSPREVLMRLAERTAALVDRHARCFRDDLAPALDAEGIHIRSWGDLDDEEQSRLGRYFRTKIFPVLTPLAVDPAHPFPYISGLSLNLAVLVRESDDGPQRFARVKVPNNVPRFVVVSQSSVESEFMPIEELIAAHLEMLFPGMEVVEHHLFRVTRNTDFEVDEDRDEDLLQALERELMRRRFGPAVRLEVADDIDDEVVELLVSEIDVEVDDVQRVPGLIDLSALWQLYDIDRPALKERPFVPATNPRFAEGETPKSVFSTMRDGDVLTHHPYESFATSVQRFIEQAAADPNVLAIKQTLYRTSGDSPIVDALIDAAEAGKQVVALVEIKARFDEQANIKWARALERAGCHVVYGLVGLKTHCKTALVVRQEGGNIRRYAHIGTGNYNPKTARTYEDLGLFTADEAICADVTDLFNVLTGYSRQTEYRSLMVAPYGVRSGLIDRIEREIAHARAGRHAHVQFKTNHLVDEQVIDALYRASLAGVQVDLLARTFCTIRSGVPGLSENVATRSILGRFLEHSRIYYFGNDESPEYWIGSADLMHRNLDRRVEVLCPVADPGCVAHLRACLDLAFSPDTAAWELGPDDEWTRSSGKDDYQELLMRMLADRGE
ncbi:MAG TPA: RNA degradosome polyphosphate kinase [Jatrophihabitantaceae bacterium]|nr:RNA degradosome polyphosphate kinase [Jatrophihabitantaceae bacterium]